MLNKATKESLCMMLVTGIVCSSVLGNVSQAAKNQY